jgi:hypothetical protein
MFEPNGRALWKLPLPQRRGAGAATESLLLCACLLLSILR